MAQVDWLWLGIDNYYTEQDNSTWLLGKEVSECPKLKGKPGECSPEQIRECHGDVKEHPCVEQK